MKHWEKVLGRAPKKDKDRLEEIILMLERKEFPKNTIKLSDTETYRTRVGDWRIQFHYEDSLVMIDDISRRDGNTYR